MPVLCACVLSTSIHMRANVGWGIYTPSSAWYSPDTKSITIIYSWYNGWRVGFKIFIKFRLYIFYKTLKWQTNTHVNCITVHIEGSINNMYLLHTSGRRLSCDSKLRICGSIFSMDSLSPSFFTLLPFLEGVCFCLILHSNWHKTVPI